MNVYFVQAGDERGPIKIGISGDVAKRVSSIQTGNPQPCRLLASFEHKNAVDVERRLHDTFSDLRMEGEWFTYDERISDVIDAWRFIESDQGRGDNKPTRLLDLVRESRCRQVIGGWWVVTWDDKKGTAHTQPLIGYLAMTHGCLLFDRNQFGSDVIVAIVETPEEADRLLLALEPWLVAMRIARTAGLGNGYEWWRGPASK